MVIHENLLKYMRLYWTVVHKKEEVGISRLHKLAFDVSFPLLERCRHAIVYIINA